MPVDGMLTRIVNVFLTPRSDNQWRRRFEEVLEVNWKMSEFEMEFATMAESFPDPVRKEMNARMQKARLIKDFIDRHPTPVDAFHSLTGHAPAGSLAWEVRAYGICLLGEAADLEELGCPKSDRVNGWSMIHPSYGDMHRHISLVKIASSEHAKTMEHEFVHQYIQPTRLGERSEEFSRAFYARDLHARRWPIERLEEDYSVLVREYANTVIREELAAHLSTEPENLIENDEGESKNDRMQKYLFRSSSYPLPNLYAPYFSRMPSSEHRKKFPHLNLLAERIQELGPPHTVEKPSAEQKKQLRDIHDDIYRRTEAISNRYERTYQQIIHELHDALDRGVERFRLVDLVIDHEFDAIPGAMRRL